MRKVLELCSVLLLLALPEAAHGLVRRETLDGLVVCVYAPDWTWQKENVNILLVFENNGAETIEAGARLEFPPGKEDHFALAGSAATAVTVSPGATVRAALTNIRALGHVPRQVYDLELVLTAGDRERRIAYPLRTIRGSAVSDAHWAVYGPVAATLLWSLLFAGVLRRYAQPGAWKQAPPAVDGGKA